MSIVYENEDGSVFIDNYKNFLRSVYNTDDVDEQMEKTLKNLLLSLWKEFNKNNEIPFYLGDSIYALEYVGYIKLLDDSVEFTDIGNEIINKNMEKNS